MQHMQSKGFTCSLCVCIARAEWGSRLPGMMQWTSRRPCHEISVKQQQLAAGIQNHQRQNILLALQR